MSLAKPTTGGFDPDQPFEIVEDDQEDAAGFDPNAPFEILGASEAPEASGAPEAPLDGFAPSTPDAKPDDQPGVLDAVNDWRREWGRLTPEQGQQMMQDRRARVRDRVTALQKLGPDEYQNMVDRVRRIPASQRIEQAKAELADIDAALQSGAVPSKTRLRSYTEDFGREGVAGLARTIEGAESLADYLPGSGLAQSVIRGVAKDPDSIPEDPLGEPARKVREFAERTRPGDPTRRDEFGSKLAGGAGQMASVVAAAPVGGARAMVAAGALQEGESLRQEAEAAGADEDKQLLSYVAGLGLGSTEAIPLTRALNRLDRVTGGRVKKIILGAGANAGEEALQEVLQTIGENAVAKALYDETRDYFDNVKDAATVGGALGGLFGLGTGSVGALQQRQEAPDAREPVKTAPDLPENVERVPDAPVDAPARQEDTFPGDAPPLDPAPERLGQQDEADARAREIDSAPPPQGEQDYGAGNPVPPLPETIDEERDIAVRDLADAIEAVRKRPKGPVRLAGFVKNMGGVQDPGGDVAAIAGGPKGQPGLLNRNGAKLDDLTQAAWDAGYIGQPGGERPSIQEFLDALDEDLRGNAQYAYTEDMEEIADQRAYDEIEDSLRKSGIDPNESADAREIARRAVMDAEPDAPIFNMTTRGGPLKLEPGEHAIAAGPGMNPLLENQRMRPLGVAEADVREAAPRPDKLVRLERKLIGALGLTARRGEIKNKKAAGIYKENVGVVRRQGSVGHEIEVLTHEGGHHLEMSPRISKALQADLKTVIDAHEGDIMEMAYQQAKASGSPKLMRNEGFAEFLRYYVTNPDYAQRHSGGFYRDFETVMEKQNPKALKALREIRDEWEAYLTTSSVAALKSHVVSSKDRAKDTTAIGRVLEPQNPYSYGDKIYTEAVDEAHPIKTAVDYLVRHGAKRPPSELYNPEALSRIAGAWRDIAEQDLSGVLSYDQETTGEHSLGRALNNAFEGKKATKAQREDFSAYLVARRAEADFKRISQGKQQNRPIGVSLEDTLQAIKDLEARYPGFRDGADEINGLWRDVLTLMRDSGLVSPEEYQTINEARDFYVPLMRLHDQQSGAVGGASQSKALKRSRGSDLSVIDPVEMTAPMIAATRRRVEMNRTNRALAELAASTQAGGAIMEPLPAKELKRLRVQTDQALAKSRQDLDLDPDDRKALNAVLRDVEFKNGYVDIYHEQERTFQGQPVVWVWEAGEKQPYLLSDGKMGEALQAALEPGVPERPGVLQSALETLFFVPSVMVQVTVTTAPDFIGANLMRDQPAAWMLGRGRFIPFVSTAQVLADVVRGTGKVAEYRQMGGVMGGVVTDAIKARSAWKLAEPGKMTGAVKRLAKIAEWSETATRVAVYDKAKAQALRDGMSEAEARNHAVRAANDVADWRRHGARTQFLRRSIVFLNPWIVSMDRQRRAIVPGAIAANKMMKGGELSAQEQRDYQGLVRYTTGLFMLGAVGAVMSALFSDDEGYDEFMSVERARNWYVPLANGNTFAWPKPFEHAVASAFFERAYEGIANEDPQAAENLLQDIWHMYSPPSLMPVTAKLWAEEYGNRDMFFGMPLVGMGEETLPLVEQYNDYTADQIVEFSKNLEELTGIQTSPMRIQHLLFGLTTSWSRNTLGTEGLSAPNAADRPLVRRFVKQYWHSSVTNKHFSEIAGAKGSATREKNLFGRRLKSGGFDVAYERLTRKGVDPIEQSLAVSQALYDGFKARHHPLRWADDLRSDVISPMRDGVKNNERLDPVTRSALGDSLAKLDLWQKRAALILVGDPAYEGKSLEDAEKYRDNALLEIAMLDRETFEQLSRDMQGQYKSRSPYASSASAKRKYPTYLEMKEKWPAMRDEAQRLVADPAALRARLEE